MGSTWRSCALLEYLAEHPRIDCDEAEVLVLQFDQVTGTKTADVSELIHHARLEDILADFAKCVVRRANGHRCRTAASSRALRGGRPTGRASAFQAGVDGVRVPAAARAPGKGRWTPQNARGHRPHCSRVTSESWPDVARKVTAPDPGGHPWELD